jgi:hypothetical protein
VHWFGSSGLVESLLKRVPVEAFLSLIRPVLLGPRLLDVACLAIGLSVELRSGGVDFFFER